MANPEHLEHLHCGSAEQWNSWKHNQEANLMREQKHRNQGRAVSLVRFRPDLNQARLKEKDLRCFDLSSSDLKGADLSEANLTGVNLNFADLEDGDLSSAILQATNFGYARLTRARLENAFIICADFFKATLDHACLDYCDASLSRFRDANLHEASLRSMNLGHADLTGADLRNVDLYSTLVGRTVFSDVDLSGARNLDTIEHCAPSSIGIDTLYKSHGKIPEVFLRGCGLEEVFIQYLPNFLNQPIQFCSCFISYSSLDKPFARRLHDALQGKGIRCWLDEHQLLPGDDIHAEIDRGIRLYDKVLLCCSKKSLTSWWVDNEVETAFTKERDLMKERGHKVHVLIPIDLDGYLFSPACAYPKATQIKSRFPADMTGWESDTAKFETQFEQIVKALRTGGTGKPPPPKPQL